MAAESQWGKLALPSQTPAAHSKWHCEDPLHPAIDWTVTPLPLPCHHNCTPTIAPLYITPHTQPLPTTAPALALPLLPCHHHFTPVLHHCHCKSPRSLQTITAHHHRPCATITTHHCMSPCLRRACTRSQLKFGVLRPCNSNMKIRKLQSWMIYSVLRRWRHCGTMDSQLLCSTQCGQASWAPSLPMVPQLLLCLLLPLVPPAASRACATSYYLLLPLVPLLQQSYPHCVVLLSCCARVQVHAIQSSEISQSS